MVYFDTIRDIGPASVIDVGMMLMRENVVSRQAGEIMLPEKTKMYGLYPEVEEPFPVYDVVYDGIYKEFGDISDEGFDLLIYLPFEREYLEQALKIKAKYILTRFEFLTELSEIYSFSYMNKVIEDGNEYVVCVIKG